MLARLLLTLKTKPFFSSPETNSSPVPDGNLGHIPQQASQMDPTSRGRRLDLLPLRILQVRHRQVRQIRKTQSPGHFRKVRHVEVNAGPYAADEKKHQNQ